MKNYPFVLGAQSLRMIDLAAFYAAIVNEGLRVTPYAINSIEQNGHAVYKHQPGAPVMMAGGDRAAFYQLRTILEGVVTRGTAASLRHLTTFVGGKTGTTDNENDAWFVGFTSDVTVAVWVGYDNARGKQTLGRGSTGGHTAVPIVEPIIQATWNLYGPKTPLPPPSAEAARRLKALPIDYASGQSSPPTARTGSPSISSSTPTRRCGTLNTRWPGAAAWRAASRGPAWQAVLRLAPVRTLSRSGGNMRSHPRAGGCRRRIECRETCASCWVCERHAHKSA